MKIALPSKSSRLFPYVTDALSRQFRLDLMKPPDDRRLFVETDEHDFVFCRGTDVPRVVGEGCADVGFSGYDVAVEWMLGAGKRLDVFLVGNERTSTVVLASREPRRSYRRVFTEYFEVASSWLSSTSKYSYTNLVRTCGSSEGLASSDCESACVVLRTSGVTLEQNQLAVIEPILSTDLCLICRTGDFSKYFPVHDESSFTRLELPSFVGE